VKGLRLALAPCWVALATTAVAAQPEVDCPLARESYSSRTPLLDLLIDPSARAVLERVAPSLLKPPFGGDQWPTQPPTFAAILTPEAMSKTFNSRESKRSPGRASGVVWRIARPE
jgi:hypothetical protein